MARQGIYPLRLDPEERARWDEGASRARCSLAEFIRTAVEEALGPPDPPPSDLAGEKLTKGRGRKSRGPSRAECPRARFHRAGTFCKACGVAPEAR